MGKNPSHFKGEKNLPVETVSWDDCQEFIKKLREKDKKHIVFPPKPSGNMPAVRARLRRFILAKPSPRIRPITMASHLWQRQEGRVSTENHASRQLPSKCLGLHDMHGNVWQWCQDWYGDYPQKDVVDPQGPENGEFRVLRGGSWITFLSIAARPSVTGIEPGSRSDGIGFRVCFFVE